MSLPPRVRELAAGLGMTEGPLQTPDGRLVVASVNRGLLYEVFLDARPARVAADTGGGPNGLATGPDGAVWVAQNGASHGEVPAVACIQRWTERVDVVIADALTAPNDCVTGPDGRFWFTDPAGHPFDEEGPLGAVRAVDTASSTVRAVVEGLRYPNGLAFGVDPHELFVAETAARRVVRCVPASSGDGWVVDRIFAELPVGHPDGMAFDTAGTLYVAAPTADAVFVFSPDGGLRETIELGPSFPTNCAFAGPDRSVLVVTAAKGGRVLALEVEARGLLA